MNDEQLIKKAISGHSKSFEKLLIKMEDQLYRTAYIYMQNANDAIDVLQETAYRSMKSIHQVKEPKYFKTWLMRILINVSYDELKKRKASIPLHEIEYFTKQKNEEKQLIDQIDVQVAISKLKDDYKDVIILYYYDELTIKEIADSLQKPEGTIKSHLHRGKEELKNLLKGDVNNGKRTNKEIHK